MTSQVLRFVGSDAGHDDARTYVCGKPVFIEDIPVADDALYIHVIGSPIAAGKLTRLDLKKVRDQKGVVTVVDASDIPGPGNIGPVVNDEPVFAGRQILYCGQPLFAVAAETMEIARSAAKRAILEYEAIEPVLTIDQADRQKTQLSTDVVIKRGRSAPAIKNAEHVHAGHFSIGGQEHFYLEGQNAIAVPGLMDELLVYSSTQNVFYLQQSIIRTLKHDSVTVKSLRIGGSFGGKQSQSVRWAIISALVAYKTKRPAVLRLDRACDMAMTGKRHDFEVNYQVGYDKKGIIKGVDIALASRCGCSEDLSALVNDHALLHVDNAYYLRNISVTSKRYKTNTVSNTVFRGSGKPQGVLVIERIIDEIAARLGLDPLKVRINNLYGKSTGMMTHYGMRVADESMLSIIDELKRTSTYIKRRKKVAQFNSSSPVIKRGIALTPVKLGVSPGKLNQSVQAGALVDVEKNGLIQVFICGAEVGQGLLTKVAQIVAEVFQVDTSHININPPRTDVFAQLPATTGSSSLDLNGRAVQRAAEKLKKRLTEFAIKAYGQPENKIKFTPEGIKIGRKTVQFKTLVAQASAENLRLSEQDSFAAEQVHFDTKKGKGHPFSYFINGAAVAEVAIDSLSGECKVLRADILQDCGQSINSNIDIGQIEGGFIQGMGWMMMEELVWNSNGELLTQDSSTYKVPVCSDLPEQFNVRFWKHGKVTEHGIFNSKVVGELPLVLAISVYSAINQAVASVKNTPEELPVIDIPATPQRILMAINGVTQNETKNV